MVCIEKRPYTLYGRLATLHFRYLTCLLDRGHIRCKLHFHSHCKYGTYGNQSQCKNYDITNIKHAVSYCSE